jgi:hypothetical protein
MNALVNLFATNARIGPSVRPHVLPLQVREESDAHGVFAIAPIAAGVFLGGIEGERKYVWEVIPSEWTLFVDDETVIDMTNSPRDIFAYVREDFDGGDDFTCELVGVCKGDGHLHVGFRTLRHVQAGEELVYHRSQELWLDVIHV